MVFSVLNNDEGESMTAWIEGPDEIQYAFTGQGFTGWVRYAKGRTPNGSWAEWNEITGDVR